MALNRIATRFRAGSVCRRWNSIVNKLNENDEYWRILCDARATDVKTLELPCEGVAQNKLYKYYYLTYLRGIQRGVKLLKDPYVGAPYFTHEWSCNVCNASGSHAVYHCAICGVYDMCRDCYSNGRRCRHDCVKMTSWWMTNYRFFTATRPAPVDTKKLLAIKASAAHTAAEDFPIQICMNFDEPDGPISDEDNVLRAPRPSVFFLFGGPPAHLHNAAGADGEPVEEDDEDEDEEVEGEGPQSSDEDAE